MSSRSNTTQASHLGAFTEGAAQVTLYDTPGVVITRRARLFIWGGQTGERALTRLHEDSAQSPHAGMVRYIR